MPSITPPLYGNFTLNGELSLEELVSRMQNISSHFFDDRDFSTYIVLRSGKRYYGLDPEELLATYPNAASEIRTISSSASSPSGMSVRIQIQYEKPDSMGLGQYVIATRHPETNEEIREMIQGIWTPRPEPEPIPLLDILEGVKKAKAIKEKPVSPKRISIQDRFHADKRISIEKILLLLEEISVIFLDKHSFDIQLATTQGTIHFDSAQSEIKRFLAAQRVKVFRMHMHAEDNMGQSVSIKVSFDPFSVEPNAKVDVLSYDSYDIQELIRESLSIEPSQLMVMGDGDSWSENFRFNEATFKLEKLIALIHTVSADYLQRASPVVLFSNRMGESFPYLTIAQLEELYDRYLDSVNVIAITMTKPNPNRALSLMLQFGNDWLEAYGTFSIRWNDKQLHTRIRKIVWERLELLPFTSPGSIRSPQITELIVDPTFSQRIFEPRPNTSMVIMPLEAYWSETLWMHIQTTLQSVGFDCIRAEPLFTEDVLERNWIMINEAQLIIVDVTYKQPEVFYLLGVAHTLGKRIIIVSQHKRDVPQDFNHMQQIVYDNNIPGLRMLAEGLIGMIGNS